MPNRAVAVDWSGREKGSRRHIWLAEANCGRLVTLRNGRSREEVAEDLISLAQQDPNLVVGLDFAFSFPQWFLTSNGCASATDFWIFVAENGERWLNGCRDPFWGRPGRGKPSLEAHFRLTEKECPSCSGITPKSCFQINGAGAVGTGSIRGMPILRSLQVGGYRIWPFDDVGYPLVVEIYPRLLTGPVKKNSKSDREIYLLGKFPNLSTEMLEKAAFSDDSFDAAVSALVMSCHLNEIDKLPSEKNNQRKLEGRIWYPGC